MNEEVSMKYYYNGFSFELNTFDRIQLDWIIGDDFDSTFFTFWFWIAK